MKMETAKMSERGQIIIPKGVREQIHADTNTVFVVDTLDKDTIVMKKLDSEAYIKEFKEMRKRTAKLSSAQIEELIHEVRKENKKKLNE
jgi:bifunctional DNA-binding transcriptional regulator/antitoxin component of YhaV-PrlF toxin-antitoxin module